MATRIYGISKGEHTVTEGVGSATAADNVELTVDFDATVSKNDALILLERLVAHIVKSQWPPA